MKRFISFILVLAALCSFTALPAQAEYFNLDRAELFADVNEGKIELIADKTELKPGDKVTVAVRATESFSATSLTVRFAYDSELFKITDTASGVISDAVNTDVAGKAVAAEYSNSDKLYEGDLFSVTFEALECTGSRDAEFTFDYVSIARYNYDNVITERVNASVRVEGAPEETPGTEESARPEETPEATVEATVEPTIEPTVEPTPEPTPVPKFTSTVYNGVKLLINGAEDITSLEGGNTYSMTVDAGEAEFDYIYLAVYTKEAPEGTEKLTSFDMWSGGADTYTRGIAIPAGEYASRILLQSRKTSIFATPTPESATPTPEPVTPTPEPATPTPEPATPTPEPVTPTPEPATPTPEPVTPTPEPVTPTPEPATPTPEPATPTPEPVTPTPEPVTPTPEPATPTPEPPTIPPTESPDITEPPTESPDVTEPPTESPDVTIPPTESPDVTEPPTETASPGPAETTSPDPEETASPEPGPEPSYSLEDKVNAELAFLDGGDPIDDEHAENIIGILEACMQSDDEISAEIAEKIEDLAAAAVTYLTYDSQYISQLDDTKQALLRRYSEASQKIAKLNIIIVFIGEDGAITIDDSASQVSLMEDGEEAGGEQGAAAYPYQIKSTALMRNSAEESYLVKDGYYADVVIEAVGEGYTDGKYVAAAYSEDGRLLGIRAWTGEVRGETEWIFHVSDNALPEGITIKCYAWNEAMLPIAEAKAAAEDGV